MNYNDEYEIVEKCSRKAERRKNEWKYAIKRKTIADIKNGSSKALHYYSKNSPWNGYSFAPNKTNNKGSRRHISKNYAPQKNWNEHDKRQINNLEEQIKELSEEYYE